MFKKAVPVFAKCKAKEKNYQLILKAETESLLGTNLSITAFSFYRLTVNGEFVGFGPARTAKGYARVDNYSLDRFDNRQGKNEIVIEVAGYYCKTLTTVKQPSFVVAELCRGDEVLLCTGRDFEGYESPYRIQKCERYSGQRHFGEIYDYTEKDPYSEKYAVSLETSENAPKYLPRRVPMPSYDKAFSDGCASRGNFVFDETLPYRLTRASFKTDIPWGVYTEEEIEYHPYRWIQRQRQEMTEKNCALPIVLSAGEYAIFDLKKIEAGFLGFSAEVIDTADVVLGFTELCDPTHFEFTNINSQNVIEYILGAGKTEEYVSFEPYTCRLAIVMVKSGSVRIDSFFVRRFEYNREDLIERKYSDSEFTKIYEAAANSFAHNALDIYMDCPSRERAGWLCDSFFTGRSEYFLTGKTLVEDAFLENYRLFENEGEIPEGALPMCYPSDYQLENNDNKFIPQWDMWYVLEVEEYLTKRNTTVDKELFRKSVYGIVDFLGRYENSDGLLEDLPSWNFVEWSTANEWVQNVNYPTNFLYVEVLRAAGRTYRDKSLLDKAEKVARITRERSFDGEVFIDNAIRDENGILKNTRNSSEAGQYYAILFGDVDVSDKKYEKLNEYLNNSFSTFDTTDRNFVEVNAFIGFYLRMCVLMKLDKCDLLGADVKTFFGGMVESTGTLWEYKQHKGSHDHGFASFAALAIDYIEKRKK